MAHTLLATSEFNQTGYIFQYIGIIGIIIGLAYLATVATSKFYKSSLGARHIKLIEKSNLATDKSLWLVELGDSYYFLYVDKNGMQKLDVIKKTELMIDTNIAQEQKTPSFGSLLKGKIYETESKNDDQETPN